MKLLHTLPFIALLVGVTAMADTLELANGKSMEGTLVGRDNGVIRFKTKEGVVVSIDEKDVKNIAFGGSAKPKKAAAPAAKPAAKPVAKAPAGPITVPAGTIINVRMKESVNSSKNAAGHKFTAALENDLVVNKQVVAKKGATVYGVLRSSQQAGRVVGKSEMTIAFTGIMINKQIKPIQTGEINAVAQTSSGQKTVGRTARFAAIGALADGSKGAKTGAKIGLGVSLLTRGGSIDIPAGTILNFPLSVALTTP